MKFRFWTHSAASRLRCLRGGGTGENSSVILYRILVYFFIRPASFVRARQSTLSLLSNLSSRLLLYLLQTRAEAIYDLVEALKKRPFTWYVTNWLKGRQFA